MHTYIFMHMYSHMLYLSSASTLEFIYICIHTYIHIYMYIYIPTYIYTYIHIYTYTYTCTYVYNIYIWIYIPTYLYICIHIYCIWTAPTGWRRLIGSPKLQIIFHKRATKYRSLLRKMTYKDKGSYESLPPSKVGNPRSAALSCRKSVVTYDKYVYVYV